MYRHLKLISLDRTVNADLTYSQLLLLLTSSLHRDGKTDVSESTKNRPNGSVFGLYTGEFSWSFNFANFTFLQNLYTQIYMVHTLFLADLRKFDSVKISQYMVLT